MHISITVLNTDSYVRRSVYRSTGLHGSKEEDDDDDTLEHQCRQFESDPLWDVKLMELA